MKVVLVSPPSRSVNHYRPPLGLMYISGYLKKNGIDSEIIDIVIKKQIRDKEFNRNKNIFFREVEDSTIERINLRNADIIGITCCTPELFEVERIAKRIKSNKPSAKVIVGGVHPTLYPDDFLGPSTPFDFVVIGEGELTMLDLAKAIRSGTQDYHKVKGIGLFDKKYSKIIITESRPLAENLDEISFPDYDDLDMQFYTTPSPYAIRGVFTKSFYILSSRGCPSSCTFCVSKKLREHYGNQGFVRFRSPDSLFNEIQKLRDKYKVDSFYLIDDLFTLKKENVYEFCDLMVKSRLPLIWACSSKVNTVDYNMLRRMSYAGCIQIDFGVEKGSDRALQDIKKGITVDRIKKTFQHCHELGIRTFANMLVNTPGEKEKDLQDIIDLVKEIKPDIVSFNVFAPYPGCEIYDLFCSNIKKEDYPLLMNTSLFISTMPEKFRFASHSVDILAWVREAGRKYNRISPNLAIYLRQVYLNNIKHSKKKREYLKQIVSLFREFINQKF
ncbi:MAG: cobalamin-dependent protein [Candidatus Omnitrophota bacterium]|nr:cobalamin-dependent protein [Candidatus Omnitrophota bacterium]